MEPLEGFDEGEAPDQPQELVREPQRALWSRWRASVMWRRISRLLRRAERAAEDVAPPEEVEVEPEPPVDTRPSAPRGMPPPRPTTRLRPPRPPPLRLLPLTACGVDRLLLPATAEAGCRGGGCCCDAGGG